MEGALIISQTIFYFVVSIAIIVIGILSGIVVYHLVCITKELKKVAENFHEASDEAAERVRELIDRLSGLPFLSFLFREKGGYGSRRKAGRERPEK